MVGIHKHRVAFLCANIAIILAYKLSIYLSTLCTTYSPVLKLFEFGEGALVNESLDEGLVLFLRAVTHVHACRLALLHILFHKLPNVRLEARQLNARGYRHLAKLQLLASGFEAMQKIKNTFFNLQLTKQAVICATARVKLQAICIIAQQLLHTNDRLSV